MTILEQSWQFFVKGGIMMIPLAIASVWALAIILERLVHLRRSKIILPEIQHAVESLKEESDIPMAISICKRHSGPFANLIRLTLEQRHLPKEDLKEVTEEEGRQEIHALESGLSALETIAGVAPLLGLLGTVIGMIKVFNVISKVGVGQASALSVGISEALITTVFGLSIGITALIFYNYFMHKAEDLVLEIEHTTGDLVRKVALIEGKGGLVAGQQEES